ncbi:MAG TPA: cytochrome c biogenesis protein ResB [Dehalococcoidia bacterium]|nr:cytochrome c biogenesis protein ResB [Dehalococcoidia bacterium]
MKFALVLVGTAVVAGAVGTVIPQVPPAARNNPAARADWLELQHEDFGALTTPMNRLDLFDIFHAPWFVALWLVIIISVTVCSVSRLRPTVRNVRRPPRSVPDSYFDSARYRANFSHRGGEHVIQMLRRRRYTVERVSTAPDGTDYLFADRFAWSHYGTFLSHLALLLLLLGVLLTFVAGFSRTMIIYEDTPAAPVFSDAGPGQLFAEVIDSFRGIDDEGNIIDFHTGIKVRQGTEPVQCRVTVNGPCGAFGYRLHQAAFFDALARVRITGPEQRVLFDGVLDFDSQTTVVPILKVTNFQGELLVNEPMPQLATDPGPTADRADDVALGALALSGRDGAPGLDLGLAWDVPDQGIQLVVSSASGLRILSAGESIWENDYVVEFRGAVAIPAISFAVLPGGAAPGSTVQMVPRSDGSTYLVVSGIDDANMVVTEDNPATSSTGFTYTFAGRSEASGLNIRRDPGDSFTWISAIAGLVGLGITFYVPRRHLWLRVSSDRVWVAGMADRTARLGRELERLGAEMASRNGGSRG